ncbi:hypothetical protein ACP70R_031994 [Stipagrostis hirtigluma subsp. patula]
MSGKCGNCDCADKTQCVKNGNSYGVVIVDDAEKSNFEVAEEMASENHGNCKCGKSCSCVVCFCGKK